MYGSMADIHSATAEIRRGKKKDRKKIEEETTGQKYNVQSPTTDIRRGKKRKKEQTTG